MQHAAPPDDTTAGRGSAGEVFAAFLKLGLTSFGGPVAHLGYYRDELVVRRRWLSDRNYADLVALCQFLPGPGSSQTGFALGLLRAGPLGGLAAFVAFTLPSVLLMLGFAFSAARIGGVAGSGALHGLKLVAVAIVAQAVWGMARTLCPDGPRAGIALAALAALAALPGTAGMLAAIGLGAVAGLALCRDTGPATGEVRVPVPRGVGLACLALFALLLAGLPLLAGAGQGFAVFDAFFRAGALVFGGGHVVLPLLEAGVVQPGWTTREAFLAGYGAAQALPGPLFTFAAYLGAVLQPAPNGLAGAALALGAIFLPGYLLLLGVLPFWAQMRRAAWAQRAMQGTNAAVVGILAAALYSPVFTTAIGGLADLALAALCFVLLTRWRAPAWAVVALAGAGGAALAVLG